METKTVNINRRLFKKWARSYDFSLFQFWMRRFQKPVLREINFSQKPKVLDVGCGTGELLRNLSKNPGKFYGADLSPEMLAVARKKLPSAVVLKEAEVHRLPFNDNVFDYVVTTEAFHHYHSQRQALEEMKRIAKEGGKVMVVDINFFFRPLHFFFQKIEPGCVKINGKREMRQLFEKAGLKNMVQKRSFLFAVMTVGEK